MLYFQGFGVCLQRNAGVPLVTIGSQIPTVAGFCVMVHWMNTAPSELMCTKELLCPKTASFAYATHLNTIAGSYVRCKRFPTLQLCCFRTYTNSSSLLIQLSAATTFTCTVVVKDNSAFKAVLILLYLVKQYKRD